jgi:hypothetical protein
MTSDTSKWQQIQSASQNDQPWIILQIRMEKSDVHTCSNTKRVFLFLKFWMILTSFYMVPGPPIQEKAYKALLAAEMEAELSGNGAVGAAHFINNGLRLERDQCVFP